MSFVQAIDLSRTFDLSDPFIVRAISRSPKRILTAVDRVSFSIEKGTTYALVGESGSGKSTIAKMAVGLLRPTNGSLLVDGMNLNDPKLAKEENLEADVFGPLAFDNSISKKSAGIKGIKNAVAGEADVLLVPSVETGNGLVKMMIYFMGACAAGVVVGGKVPVVITSRSDEAQARLASIAAAVVALD